MSASASTRSVRVEIEALLDGTLSRPQTDVYNYLTEYSAESRPKWLNAMPPRYQVFASASLRVARQLVACRGAHGRFTARQVPIGKLLDSAIGAVR